jgi:hypothetical protein
MEYIRPELRGIPSDTPLPASLTQAHQAGAQWGLASLLLGGLLIPTAGIALIAVILMAWIGPSQLGMNQTSITLATYGGGIASLLLLALGVCGIVFASIGLARARRDNQPLALPLAGLLASIAGLLLMLMVALDAFAVIDWFNRNPSR